MMKKTVVSMAMAALFIASPLAFAVDEHHPGDEAQPMQADPSAESMTSESGDASSGGMMPMDGSMDQASGAMMMGPAMGDTGTMGSGMMMGGPGMMGQRGGMMRQMMMGSQQGADGQGGMMGPGKMRGCASGMHQGGMMNRGMGGMGGMMQSRQQLMGRLDLLDARLAKIEAMLESLLQR